MQIRTFAIVAALILAATQSDAQTRPRRAVQLKNSNQHTNSQVRSLGLFDAIDRSAIQVRAIPQSEKLVVVRMTNRTNAPIAIELPPSIAAVPILAQQQPPGTGPQNLGIGTPGLGQPFAQGGQNAGGPAGLQNQGGQFPFQFNRRAVNPFAESDRTFEFEGYERQPSRDSKTRAPQSAVGVSSSATEGKKSSAQGKKSSAPRLSAALRSQLFLADGRVPIKPRSTTTIRFPSVCMQYGNPTPNPRHQFVLAPIEHANTSPTVQRILREQASGTIDQPTAQAAMWHVTNDMSWVRLARMSHFKKSHVAAAKKLFPHETNRKTDKSQKIDTTSKGRRIHPVDTNPAT